MTPTDVTGFVMDAMRNSVPVDIGMPLAASCLPKALRYTIRSWLVTATTAPGISPFSTAAWNMRSMAVVPLALSAGRPAERSEWPRVITIAASRQIRRTFDLLDYPLHRTTGEQADYIEPLSGSTRISGLTYTSNKCPGRNDGPRH